ncbi:MAG: T9SS type A sorting domain-containing protein [Saprospiraceae bacterium]|nr:T9SS type A sorting domain-containing protein [Saprospiraceae bacterium]
MQKQVRLFILLSLLSLFNRVPAGAQGLVSGLIYGRTGEPLGLAAVDIRYNGISAKVYTDSTGYYSYYVPIAGSVTIVPDPNGVPGGPQNGLDLGDSVMLADHILGLAPLNPFQFVIADLNNSGSLTTFDLLSLVKVMNGEAPHFPDSISWMFFREGVTPRLNFNPFDPLDPFDSQPNPFAIVLDSLAGLNPNNNFVAYKNGDLNNSAEFFSSSSTGILVGEIVQDGNGDCLKDSSDFPLNNWLIKAIDGNGTTRAVITNAQGHYSMSLPPGTYTLVAVRPNNLWAFCIDTISGITLAANEVKEHHFVADVLVSCALPEVSAGTALLRRCFTNQYHVVYGNRGTSTLFDATVTVILDPFFTLTGSSIPWSAMHGDTLVFPVGDVGPTQSGAFTLSFTLDCDAPLGLTHCMDVEINPHYPCELPLGWDGSHLQVSADCDDDEVVFTILNLGSDMAEPVSYVIIEDIMIQMIQNGAIQLDSGESQMITIPANGSTWRIEVDQTPNNPYGSLTGAIVEACGADSNGTVSLGFINQFSLFDEVEWFDTDCMENIGAFDPNDKQGIPIGVSDQHWVPRDQRIEYTIRFQNTGTDTAFTVVIRDTLSALLDLASFRPGASSHPYDYHISEPGVVSFLFPNIMLPDSNVNEPASHGFVRFHIDPVGGLPNNTSIRNNAAIYFDFNDPVITNTTLHTFGEQYLSVRILEPNAGSAVVHIWPNPATDAAWITITTPQLHSGTFVLSDAAGRQVMKRPFQTNPFQVETSGLKPGMYYFRIHDGSGRPVASGKLLADLTD